MNKDWTTSFKKSKVIGGKKSNKKSNKSQKKVKKKSKKKNKKSICRNMFGGMNNGLVENNAREIRKVNIKFLGGKRQQLSHVNRNDLIYKTIKSILTPEERRTKILEHVFLGKQLIDPQKRFIDLDIQNEGQSFLPILRRRKSFNEVVRDLIEVNPEIGEDSIRRIRAFVDNVRVNQEEPWILLDSLYLHSCNLNRLPDTIGDLVVHGNLFLSRNQLTSLPYGFCEIFVRDRLCLHNNQINILPEEFADINVGQNVTLYGNPIAEADPRPEIGNLNVKWRLAAPPTPPWITN